MAHAVDEERRRSINVVTHPAAKVLTHSRSMHAAEDFAHQALRIETQRFRVFGKRIVIKLVLVFKQHIVHLPEFPLRTCRFGGLCGVFRVRMRIGKREITERKTQPVAQAFLNRLHDGMRLATIRTFIVAVFNECNGRINRPLNVITSGDWQREF